MSIANARPVPPFPLGLPPQRWGSIPPPTDPHSRCSTSYVMRGVPCLSRGTESVFVFPCFPVCTKHNTSKLYRLFANTFQRATVALQSTKSWHSQSWHDKHHAPPIIMALTTGQGHDPPWHAPFSILCLKCNCPVHWSEVSST